MVTILVDSTCDLSEQELGLSGLGTVPIMINHGGELQENRQVSPEEILRKVRESRKAATTEPASVETCLQRYTEALTKADEVLHIASSAKMSRTYQNGTAAAAQLGSKVTVLDSGYASYGLGLLALRAAAMADKGDGALEIAHALTGLREKMLFAFAVDKLDFLRINGKLSPAAALLGNLLGLKPLLKFDGGLLEAAGRVRGDGAAHKELSKMALRFSRELGSGVDICCLYTPGGKKHAEALASELSYLQGSPAAVKPLGAGVTANAGPTYGFVMLPA